MVHPMAGLLSSPRIYASLVGVPISPIYSLFRGVLHELSQSWEMYPHAPANARGFKLSTCHATPE